MLGLHKVDVLVVTPGGIPAPSPGGAEGGSDDPVSVAKKGTGVLQRWGHGLLGIQTVALFFPTRPWVWFLVFSFNRKGFAFGFVGWSGQRQQGFQISTASTGPISACSLIRKL
jgi:hypothetical protein